MTVARDGRIHQPTLVAGLVRRDDGQLEITAPAVGLWRGAPTAGTHVSGKSWIGELEILGVLHGLLAPAAGHGLVVGHGDAEDRARRPVAHGQVLLTLDPRALKDAPSFDEVADGGADDGLVFRAPSSGRFYRRASPEKPPFVEVGDTVIDGQTIGLLEIMKTFHRTHYRADPLPARARVTAIVAEDQSDLEAGDPILTVEPVS